MVNSPQTNQTNEENNPQQRLCDYCGESKALLYCKADSAKLCFNCDREVHSTNQLFTKHARSQLCDVCDANPASILCSTESLVLCQNCDWETHGKLGAHDRRSVDGFTGCPSTVELCSILGVEDVGKKDLGEESQSPPRVGGDGFEDYLVWETPAILNIDDLLGCVDSNQNFQAMGVPPLAKNRNTACGKYKEEMLSQLRDMMKLENCFVNDHIDLESLLGLEPLAPELNMHTGTVDTGFKYQAEPKVFPEGSENKWEHSFGEGTAQDPFLSAYTRSYTEQIQLVPDENADVDNEADTSCDRDSQLSHPISSETPPVLPKVVLHKSVTMNREYSITRYKEKRKTRRYDYHVRYESRKARAESRSRIRGRFAKIEH